jgi:L-amino acid N-acyltransferase YncA
VIVRLARPGDAEGMRAIYNAEVDSTSTFDLVARTPEEQRAWMQEHSGAYPAIVAVDDSGEVAGFGSLSRYRDRAAYATTVEDSVYVQRACRGRGVGRLLLEELLRLATAHGFHTVIGRIVGGNDASVGLHLSCGFVLVGVESEVGRKLGRWLDVVVVQRVLSSSSPGSL